MKIKKLAALSLVRHPICQLRQRDVLRAELEFVPLLHLDDFLPRRHQPVAHLLVMRAFLRCQRLDVAIKLALRCVHLLFLVFRR